MKFSSLSASLKLPELKIPKILITEPDDKGFAKDQYDKIINRIYTKRQLQLKPWEKDFDNIYSSSGKANHEILQNLKFKSRTKTIDLDFISNVNNEFYNRNQLNTINDSLKISNQVKFNAYMKKKMKLPPTSIKSYISDTKQMCKNKLLTDIVKSEREKIYKKQNEYDNALKQEIKTLDKDILKFEVYAANEMFEKNQKFKYINSIEKKKKNLMDEIKNLSQEYHSLKANIQKILRYINEKKIYVNFVNKLLGGEAKIGNLNLDGINIQRMEDDELHFLIMDIEVELRKNNIEENIFITATDEELMESINKIDIIFKVFEDKIIKTLASKENIRKEILALKENEIEIKKELELRILEEEKEYQNIKKEYDEEEENNFKSYSSGDYDNYIRMLLKEFYCYLNKDFIKSKDDIDQYNILDKVVYPSLLNIKEKENRIDQFLMNMEKYSEEDNELFSKSVNKVKNENKFKKYYKEKENRELEIRLKNNKIMEKFNKIFVKERNNFKMVPPLSIFKKPKNIVKKLKTETSDFKLIYY